MSPESSLIHVHVCGREVCYHVVATVLVSVASRSKLHTCTCSSLSLSLSLSLTHTHTHTHTLIVPGCMSLRTGRGYQWQLPPSCWSTWSTLTKAMASPWGP